MKTLLRWLSTLLEETGYEPDKLVLFVATLAVVVVVIVADGGDVAAPVIFSGERTSSN